MARKTVDKLLLRFFFFFFPLGTVQHLAFADAPYCQSNGTEVIDDSYFRDLKSLLGSLSSMASVTRFNITSVGNGAGSIYGMHMCFGRITTQRCKGCVELAADQILSPLGLLENCSNKTEAVVYEDECQVRYSKLNFRGKLEISLSLPYTNAIKHSDKEKFGSFVNQTLYQLADETAFDSPGGFFYKAKEAKFSNGGTLYSLMQCTLDLSPEECNKCLKAVIVRLDTQKTLYFAGARVYNPNCFLRYEEYPIPNSGAIAKNGNKKKLLIAILAPISSIFLVALSACALFAYARRRRNRKREKRGEKMRKDRLPDVVDFEDSEMEGRENEGWVDLKNQEFFIDLATIRAATLNFSPSNKLGQGGFGPVYKGTMKDGTEIAVKRLENHSDQGMAEFVNEIQLILKLQHQNLVRLLGFSVDGKEKILVYELMPNGGLDGILFDKRRRSQLDWTKRVNIIKGIAKGIIYLHEDSRLHIIHRDLKASNILLDKDMNPKISDFGIARIFAGTGCEATGVIIGTYGYMAPEYAMGGLYSIKSDVYSFGVLLIEIITGRKNTESPRPKQATSLLAHVWKLWSEGNVLNVMDPLLLKTCPLKDFLRYAQIGLLCVQEDMSDRPTMSSVLAMLKEDTTASFSEPKWPAFSPARVSSNHDGKTNDISINNLTVSTFLPR